MTLGGKTFPRAEVLGPVAADVSNVKVHRGRCSCMLVCVCVERVQGCVAAAAALTVDVSRLGKKVNDHLRRRDARQDPTWTFLMICLMEHFTINTLYCS